MRRERKKRNRIIIALCGVLLLMSAAYAAFQTQLQVNNTTSINTNWDVEIIDVTEGNATGKAENSYTPTWTTLTANMKANLYKKGDAMEYIVTIKNKGSLDAKLDNIAKNITTNNDAIKITFSGYTKGERLNVGDEKKINVKIEYDSNFKGKADYETPAKAEITFNYTQAIGSAEGGNIPTTYLLTYDYQTNGGSSTTGETEYLSSGTNVDLTQVTATRSDYEFVGWNTNKDAQTGLNSITVDADTTLYAIFKKTITITYTKGENVSEIGRENDVCTLYNMTTSCSKKLPSITASNDSYSVEGWFIDDNKIGMPNDDYSFSKNTTVEARTKEATKPTPTITGGADLKKTSLPVTLKCTDNVGVTAYYWGTTQPTSASNITTTTSLSSLTGSGLSQNITAAGTYYLGCRDAAGNFDTTSITIRKYQVQNVLEKIAGTTGTYTSTNYETNGSASTYYVKDGTTLTLSSIYTAPTEGNQSGKFKGYTTSAPSSSTASPSTTNPTVATNDTTTYYMWFNRNTYTVTVTKPTNGSVKAETVTKSGNSVTVNSSSSGNGSLTVKYGDTVKATATPNTGYSFNGWSGYVSGTTNPVTGSSVTENKTISGAFVDSAKPTPTITGGTDLKKSSLPVTLKCRDNVGVTAYYWGTTQPSSASNITTTTSLSSLTGSDLSQNIAAAGTYYLGCRDAAGNFDTTSITIRKYQVQNVLEKIAGTTGTYTSSNYGTNGSTSTYYVKDGTSLTLSSIYTVPTEGNQSGNFKGYTTSAPSSSTASPSTTNPTVATNDTTTYYMWFNRNTYTVTVTKPTNGSVKAETVTKTGNSVTVNSGSSGNGSLTVKYGDTVKATATPNTGYSFNEWSGGYISGTTSPKTGTSVTADKTISGTFTKLDPIIQSWDSGATTDFHNSTYRENITSVIFEDSINIPNGATSWDVSKVANSGAVMAWVTADPSDSSKYILHIAGDGGVVANPDSSYVFYNFTNLKSITFGDNYDTSSVTSMQSMFLNCSSLTSLDLGNKFDTSNVTTMSNMFQGCNNLTSLDLGDKFDTSNVTSMAVMFYGCSSLTSLDLGEKFDTSKVTNMQSMFLHCSSLTSLDLGDKFNTSSVTNMSTMFWECSSLTSLDLSSFNTSNVTSMYSMFFKCSSLTSLDLSSFDTSIVTTMSNMFQGCSNLQTIYVSDSFDTSSVTSSSNMFYQATKLVGGNGTAVATKQVYDKTYALIDEPGQEGYFTSYLQPRVATRATTNSINVIVTMDSSYGTITKYEFSKDGGTTWINNGTNKTYNFTGLTKETTYNIMVRVTDSSNNTYTSTSREVTTLAISTPTFRQKNNSTTSADVTITYPSGCGSTLTCTYKKNNGSTVNVTSKTVVVNYSAAGTLTASVTDGTNTVGSSYTLTMPSGVLNTNGVNILLATSGDGLYNNGDGTYTFKGEDPDNYLKLGNDDYRIIGIENGMLKVIRTESTSLPWDPGYSTSITGITSSSSTDGTRFQGLSSNTTDYCVSQNTTSLGSGYYGCKSWGSKTTTLNSSGTNVTVMPKIADNATTYNLPSDEAYLNVYLNGGTYQGVSITGWIDGLSYKSLIETHTFNVGPVASTSGQTLATDISQASAYKWSGKVGLMTVIDYVKANTNTSLCGTVNLSFSSANAATCKATNWLVTSSSQWTLSPFSTSYSYYVWFVNSSGNLGNNSANSPSAVRPVLYLKSNIQLTGEGTSGSGAYTIAS